MTSPSRRKRQTIVRSTSPATIRSSPAGRWDVAVCAWLGPKRWAVLVALALLAVWASARSAAAAVEHSDASVSSAQTASYSTGRSGGKLKWLAQRPESPQTETRVTATQYTTPSGSRRPLRTAQNQEPKPAGRSVIDPFGDKKGAPAEKLGDELLEQMPAEPKSQTSLPSRDADQPLQLEQPYVAPGGLAPLKPATPSTPDAKQPLLEQEFAARQQELKETCPSPKDLKPIGELTTNITPSEGDLPHDCPLGKDRTFQPRSFTPITYTWTASGLCHKPLYFEEVQVERYGHMWGPWVQPLVSGAHFFLTFPILPYKMGLEPPNECLYTLGYYRPGNCAPYLLDPIPLSVRGALFEAGGWLGAVYAIP
jgi:hypothetical protein